jgi:uncharacterized protein (DUF849 family)
MLQLCANGVRTRAEHPAVPMTPAAVAADAVAAAALGATDLHVHPKGPDGADTVEPDVVDAFVHAVREAVPSIGVGVTTGEWVQTGPGGRAEAIGRWTIRPDHASVNWHEAAADELAAVLLEHGVAVHAGLSTDSDGVERFLESPLASRVQRVLVEVTEPDPEAGLQSADMVLARLKHLDTPILLHGQDATCWPTFSRAVELGLDARIGLEDTLVLPDGDPAPSNVELVRHALGH